MKKNRKIRKKSAYYEMRSVIRIGKRSLCIVIPSFFCNELDIRSRDKMKIRKVKSGLLISKAY